MVQATAPRIRQPKIIERPRLTRQLDECGARIILLVAPAGYGKTTLARQWLANKPHAWCSLTPASRDVAALALGIQAAARTLIEEVGGRVRKHLRLSADPSSEVALITELLLADLAGWPEDAWLALDDYHSISASRPCECLLEGVVKGLALPTLITTRTRPAWATSRSRAYRHHYELDQSKLSMTREEAAQVTRDPKTAGLAKGWPALLGLAAALEANEPETKLADSAALHAFLAEELFKSASPSVQRSLLRLSLCPDLTFEQARDVLGASRVASLIDKSARLGLVSIEDASIIAMHPLVRRFVRRWHRQRDASWRSELTYVARRLMTLSLWDAAFEVVKELEDGGLFDELLSRSLAPMLEAGRHPTVQTWVASLQRSGLPHSPWILLAEAEVASRRGDQHTAQALSVQSAKESSEKKLAARAWNLAGRSAHLLDRHADANIFYRNAELLATSDSERFDALWGQIVACRQFDPEKASELLAPLAACADETIDSHLRLVSSKFQDGLYRGRISDLGDDFGQGRVLVSRATNPLIATSFLVIASRWFATTGQYEDALRTVEETVSLAEQYRLSFVLPSALNVRGMALAGLRKWGEATRALSAAEAHATAFDDIHNQVEAHILRMRIDLERGNHADALAATTQTWPRHPGPLEMREFDATCDLVHAVVGRDYPRQETDERFKSADILTVELATRCVRLTATAAFPLALDQLLRHVALSGCVDGFVVAYRASPVLLRQAAQLDEFRELARRTLESARDFRLAKSLGLKVTPQKKDGLTPREREVHELLAQGLTNKEIARLLYVEEVTVKVHVRHILDKLGVRSRVEAATRISG